MSEEEEIVDIYCDPKNPKKITIDDVTTATTMIRDGIIYTPCTKCTRSENYGMDLYMKKDFLQVTGSFKERGARYALLTLTEEQKKRGVITASLGNHAQGLSYHGLSLGIPVTVVLPIMAPIMKIQKCRNWKARVIVQGKDMGEAKKIALKLARDEGFLYINGYDHPLVMAGQGSIGIEILEQVPDPDAVLVSVGGGGMLAGVSVAIKALSPNTKVYGVESFNCPSFTRALENNGPVAVDMKPTLADGLAVPIVGYNAHYTAKNLIDKMIVVKEEWLALAILRIAEEEKCVVEGAGAICLAAILAGQCNELKGKKVVIHMSGGNIDTPVLGRCLDRGLASEGRLVKFNAHVMDNPTGLYELCKLLSEHGVRVNYITHERAWLRDVHEVEVRVICETRDWGHSLELKEALTKVYGNIDFTETPLAIGQIG